MTSASAESDAAAGKDKRKALRTYDLAPCQLVNGMGESAIGSVDLPTLYEVLEKGNKAVAYFSELCSDDDTRKQVAVSRLCEILQSTRKMLDQPAYKKYIEKKLFDAAMKELNELGPHLPILISKEPTKTDDKNEEMTIGRLNYAMNKDDKEEEKKEEPQVEEAAKAMHKWLSKPKSDLRSLLALLSGNGLFYVAQCHEKSHRAYLQQGCKRGSSNEADFVAMNKKRLCQVKVEKPKGENNDMPE